MKIKLNSVDDLPLNKTLKFHAMTIIIISVFEKDYMKIKFNSDEDLPLNKPLKFHAMNIIIRSVFEEDGKLYPQVFLDDTLYELNV